MANRWTRWWSRGDEAGRDSRLAALEQENAELRQEVAENRYLMTQWQEEVQAARKGFGSHIDDALEGKLAYFFHDLSHPASELIGQCHRLKEEGSPAEAAGFLDWANRLLVTLEKFGMRAIGTVGECSIFDPERHEIIDPDGNLRVPPPKDGTPVVVREVGIAYRERLIRKARVTTEPK